MEDVYTEQEQFFDWVDRQIEIQEYEEVPEEDWVYTEDGPGWRQG